MQDRNSQRLLGIVIDLKELIPIYHAQIIKLENKLANFSRIETTKYVENRRDLTYSIFHNALIKLRLILENNFSHLETIGLLGTARYVFEMLVWLRLLDNDIDSSLVFYGKLVSDQTQHYKSYRNKMEDEIALFEELEKEERRLAQEGLRSLNENENATSASHAPEVTRWIMNEVDRRARRAFSIYAESAKENGYSFQAYLIRNEIVKVDAQIAELETEGKAFVAQCAPEISKRIKDRFNWKVEAERAGMLMQYEFIYTFSSRLLHATPSSAFTAQKNLEMSEMVLFLDYIYVSMLDVLDLVSRQVGSDLQLN